MIYNIYINILCISHISFIFKKENKPEFSTVSKFVRKHIFNKIKNTEFAHFRK